MNKSPQKWEDMTWSQRIAGFAVLGALGFGLWGWLGTSDPSGTVQAPAPASAPIASDNDHVPSTTEYAAAWFDEREDIQFLETGDPMVRMVATDPDNPIMAHIGDVTPGITRYILCPQHDSIRETRLGLVQADFDALIQVVDGRGCFLAKGGWGWVHAVHRSNVVALKFEWLEGVDLDSAAEERLEQSGRIYWAHPHQVFLTGKSGDDSRIESLKKHVFR